MSADQHKVPCRLCREAISDYIGNHLAEAHATTVADYLTQFPGAPTTSDRLLAKFTDQTKALKRAAPPTPDKLSMVFGGVPYAVNAEVPASACLPLPAHYRVPKFGKLGEAINHVLVSLYFGRSTYVWGMPGSGKDAVFHAWSAQTRTPAMLRQVKPGTDIEAWFFSQGFNDKGTYWEEGDVLKALRDGYVTATGKRIPYLVLATDFDRADRNQAEHLRLITDTIQGRIDGPHGTTFPVLPGTRIGATANTAGGGDERGRMISANPIDASILDRFDRKFQFPWMDWRDEGEIVKDKFPLLFQRFPSAFDKVGKVTESLREAILKGDLHAEFSHRGLCNILSHSQDILQMMELRNKPLDKAILKRGCRAWLDGLPDEENRSAAAKIMDPTLGTLDEGAAPGKVDPLSI